MSSLYSTSSMVPEMRALPAGASPAGCGWRSTTRKVPARIHSFLLKRAGSSTRLAEPSSNSTYITLHYITLHYITLHYITLHYITLHYITLHYITLQDVIASSSYIILYFQQLWHFA